MPISTNDIEIGWLYKNPNNQERVVLAINSEGKIQYTSRGGNVQNSFDVMNTSSPERFAEACSEKVRSLSENEFNEIKSTFVSRGLVQP